MTTKGFTKEQLKDIPMVIPEFTYQIDYRKKPPFMITGIKFLNGFYHAKSAKAQEDILRDLWEDVKRHRKERYEVFIGIVRRA